MSRKKSKNKGPFEVRIPGKINRRLQRAMRPPGEKGKDY